MSSSHDLSFPKISNKDSKTSAWVCLRLPTWWHSSVSIAFSWSCARTATTHSISKGEQPNMYVEGCCLLDRTEIAYNEANSCERPWEWEMNVVTIIGPTLLEDWNCLVLYCSMCWNLFPYPRPWTSHCLPPLVLTWHLVLVCQYSYKTPPHYCQMIAEYTLTNWRAKNNKTAGNGVLCLTEFMMHDNSQRAMHLWPKNHRLT